MAAFIPKNSLLTASKLTVRASYSSVQVSCYSDKPYIIENPSTHALKRGTGGRSSFSGVVCTIFGNSGFVGKTLVTRLGRIGTQMILPYRSDHYRVAHLKLCGDLGQILYHPFELDDEDSIRRSIKYSNVVINLIGRNWETKNVSYNDVNVEGPRRLARLCKEMGVKRFIHMSSLKASPNPPELRIKGGSKFLKSKWEGEMAVKNEFPEAIIIRSATMFGRLDKFLHLYTHDKRTQHRSSYLWKGGEMTECQPIWVGDVCRGIVNIVNNPKISGQVYQFAGPRRYKLSDIIDWLNEFVNKETTEMGPGKIHEYQSLLQWKYMEFREKYKFISPSRIFFTEGLETECISEDIIKGIPTIEDLGVDNLETVENMALWELKHKREDIYYTESLSEHTMPPFATTLPLKLKEN